MSDIPESSQNPSAMEIELYFLIAKFLSTGPCQRSAEVLREELHQHELLPKRLDWEGQEHVRSFENLNETHRHISSNHLFKICQRIVPLLNRDVKPSVEGVMSLLGAGRQSILRTEEDVKLIRWPSSTFLARHHGYPLKPPSNLKYPPNLVSMMQSRQSTGYVRSDHALPDHLYTKMTQLSRSLGHLSAVYCVSFDRSGNYIFTGSDDHLLKIWSAINGRLLCTLRGHGAEITDITCSYDNTLLAAGSCDKLIRIWCLQTSAPVAVLHGHGHMITSLRFCPYARGNVRYLASTGGDGCLCVWEFNQNSKIFNLKPIKFIERSRAGTQMLCLSFSPGGAFLATGSSDNVIRVYYFSGHIPEKICELEAHKDRIDSIQYANGDSRFISASEDGTARIWRFFRQEWKAIVLNAYQTLTDDDVESKLTKYRVTMACWSSDDHCVITAVSDFTLKVWNSFSGELLQVLRGHGDEVFVLEHNPIDIRILLSAGHDGNIIIWDIFTGQKIKTFHNSIEGQGHGSVFDCKWSPNGQNFAATDSHGFLLYFGFGSNDKYKKLPEEIFFHTDYRPLIRDANNYVLDEQTQHPPHLMPPPFLVDIDGNPYPARFQRLVPGREDCQDTMLVPLVVMTANGDREVVDDLNGEFQAMAVVEENPRQEAINQEREEEEEEEEEERPIIDEMIARMQHEQDQRLVVAENVNNRRQNVERREGGSRLRRNRQASREVVNVRPRQDNDDNVVVVAPAQRQQQQHGRATASAATNNHCNWSQRMLVKDLETSLLTTAERWRNAKAEEETRDYLHERRKKPVFPSEFDSSDSCASHMRTRKHEKKSRGFGSHGNEETGRNRLLARALYDTETEGSSATEYLSEHERFPATSARNVSVNLDEKQNASGSESTEYSDWVPDDGTTLQPPKRRSKRKVKRPRWRLSDNEDDTDGTGEEEEDEEEEEGDEEEEEKVEEEEHQQQAAELKDSEKLTPRKKQQVKKRKRKLIQRKKQQQKVLDHRSEIREVPPDFRPPDWLTSVVPRKAPYFPQMGDEVIYFLQGHQKYMEAVKTRNAYSVDPNKAEPWNKQPMLREQELMKVVGIKYEIRPPRLVCLKLAFIDPNTSKLTGGTFTVKFHDMPDVIDFVILRQTYDVAMNRNWSVGDRFRCLIDDTWWHGVVTVHEPFQEEYPDSMFQCMVVKWDNGETERLSPWDLEPIDKHRIPASRGGSVPVIAQELTAMSYTYKPSEWPSQGRETECDRIIHGLEQMMELSIAEPFLVPVDLNAFPIYAMIIEYPIDLSTIKERLENRFYRRVAAIQYDVRQIEQNTRTFNEKNSNIVKYARIVTELFLRLISDTNCYDLMPLYNKLTKDSHFAVVTVIPRSDLDVSEDDEESSRRTRREGDEDGDEGTSSRRSVNQRMLAHRSSKDRRKKSLIEDPDAWKEDCRQLLETMIESNDSLPFRRPVDVNEFVDYNKVIIVPMDLGSIRNHLLSDDYETADDFCRDVRLVFKNSRTYNTNKRSRIYAMTLRLSAMFEDQFQSILSDFNSSIKYRKKKKRGHKQRSPTKMNSFAPSTRSAHLTTVVMTTTLPMTSPDVDYPAMTSGGSGGRRSRIRGQHSSSSSYHLQPQPLKRTRIASDDSDQELKTTPSKGGQKNYSIEATTSSSSQPSRRIKTRSKIPRTKQKYRGTDGESSEEEEGEMKEENHKSQRDEEENDDDDDDEDFKVNRRRNRKSQKIKKQFKKQQTSISPKKSREKQQKSMTNGGKSSSSATNERYGTRCATGSLKRRRYDRGLFNDDDEEEEEVNSTDDDDDSGGNKKKKRRKIERNNFTRIREKSQSAMDSVRALPSATDDDDSSTDDSLSEKEEQQQGRRASGSETEAYSDRSGPTLKRTSSRLLTRSSNLPTVVIRSCDRDVARNRLHVKEQEEEDEEEEEEDERLHYVGAVRRKNSSRYSTRNQGRRTVRYQEDSDLERGDSFLDHVQSEEGEEDEDEDEINQQNLMNNSSSSRGRIRKPNPRVRTSL